MRDGFLRQSSAAAWPDNSRCPRRPKRWKPAEQSLPKYLQRSESQARGNRRPRNNGVYLMGLLDHLPEGLLELIARTRNPNAAAGADGVDSTPSLQRLPLSLAGPEPAASQGSFLPADATALRPSGPLPRQTSTAQNLTAQVLRSKGVPDSDIAAGIKDPDLMRQIINQHYAAGPSGAPAFFGPDAKNWPQFDDAHVNHPGPISELDRRAPVGTPSLLQPAGFKCDGFSGGCKYGGNYGDNAMYRFDIGDLCRKCAIKWTGASNLPTDQQMEIIEPFLIKMK
jgi:hypothetical protein